MSGLLHIVKSGEVMSLIFDTLANAEKFLRGQSSNLIWLEQWELKLESHYGESRAVARTTRTVTLAFEL